MSPLEKEIIYFQEQEKHFGKSYSDNTLVAGIDEAGRGSLAGPVAVSIAVFSLKSLPLFLSLPIRKVNDSKQLKSSQRNFLAREIQKHTTFQKIVLISAKIIDESNINRAIDQGIRTCLSALRLQELRVQKIILDGNRLHPDFIKIFPEYLLEAIVQADANFFSVACASILSKQKRDNLMRKLDVQHPEYHFAQNKGYPTIDHRKSLMLYGSSPEHRLTYRWKKPRIS